MLHRTGTQVPTLGQFHLKVYCLTSWIEWTDIVRSQMAENSAEAGKHSQPTPC
jgi:hypothetical protein